jgi:hypothetical protein
MSGKRGPNDPNPLFKKKEKEGGEGRCEFGGQWKENDKHLFTSSHFPPNKFYLNLHLFL